MAMRNVYVSRRYARPVVVGLLLCSLSGFALGQALGHRPATPPAAASVVHATGALGTATPTITPTPTISTPTTTANNAPAQLLSAPVVAHPDPAHHHDKRKPAPRKHDGEGAGPPHHHGGHGGD